MAEPAKGGKIGGLFKALMAGAVGLGGGVAATYATAVVNQYAKPAKPVANFAVTADGLTVTCENHAIGESGWWDFGDGTPLEPFAPSLPTVSHTYAKPGNYDIKLTVRNFLMEETDRSVPVDLSPDSAPQSLPPSITALAVEPIGTHPVAPATFRIKGEVKNAQQVIWDLGDNKLEVTPDPGPFERLVVFEKPGRYPIQLIGHSGKQAVKQAAFVDVAAPMEGSLSVVLRVAYVGTRTDRQQVAQTVAMPVPGKDAKITDFEKSIPARAGFAIVEVRIGKLANQAVKNVQVVVAPDKKSVKLTGQWTATGEALTKAAGGSDVLVPLTLVEEKSVAVTSPPETMSSPLTGFGAQVAGTLPMPPMPRAMAGAQRKIQLEIRQATADGKSKVLTSAADVKLPWNGQLPASVAMPGGAKVSATMVGNQLRVSVGR